MRHRGAVAGEISGAANPAGPASNKAAWWVAAACFGCLVGEAIGTYIFTPMLKPVVAEFGWTRTQFALSGLFVSLVMMASVPAAGMLADRGRGRSVLAVGAVCLGAALYLFSRMQGLAHFYLITALMGLGVGCLGGVPTTALISRWFDTDRGFGLGVVGLGHSVGGFLIPPVVTWITLTRGWRSAFEALSWFAWLVLVPLILMLVRDPARPTESGGGDEATLVGEPIAFRDGFRSATFRLLAAAMFLHIVYFSAVTVHFVAFATDVGFSPEKAASAFGILIGLGIVGRLGFGWLGDRYDPRKVMVAALGLTAVAALCLQGIARPGVLQLFIVLQGLGVVGVQTLFGLVVGECFGTKNVGTFLGAAMLFQVPGGVLGAILAAVSFDSLGTYIPAFALFAAGNVVAAFAIAAVQPYRPASLPAHA